MRTTFEYCALHYLDQWLGMESGWHRTLIDGTRTEKLEALLEAAGFFGISRNAPIRPDESANPQQRFSSVLALLERSDERRLSRSDVCGRVMAIERALYRRYRGKGMLSFASKMMWLKYRRPVVIYDRKARRSLGFGAEVVTYDRYYERWRARYGENAGAVELAASRLPSISRFSRFGAHMPRDELTRLCARSWFKERIFDIFLWHEGA